MTLKRTLGVGGPALFVAAMALAAGPDIPQCDGRPCPVEAQSAVDPHCGPMPKGCVCEYSPRTKTWGIACPKHPR